MAPSLRKGAPSSRSVCASSRAASTKKAQLSNADLKSRLGFARVTKSSLQPRSHGKRLSDGEKKAVESFVEGGAEVAVETEIVKEENSGDSNARIQNKTNNKRKRSRDDGIEDEDGTGTSDGGQLLQRIKKFDCIKKRKVQAPMPTPPASRSASSECDELKPKIQLSSELPQVLSNLISMHAAFLKALSLHFAHNGPSAPAELNAIMDSTTRLWKKQTLRRQDLQRMLGVYEIVGNTSLAKAKQVNQKTCPFKIVTTGLGLNVRTNIEYIGQSPYCENGLQTEYSDVIQKFSRTHQSVDSVASLPLLTATLGAQTSIQRAKAASTRAEILSLSAAAQYRSTPDFSKLSITDPSDHTPASVKSRTMSLFDRVRAKGLASTSSTAPTPEQILRRHAIGRVSEVVEFLRMKQQLKMATQFHSSIHDSPGRARGKVSFSLNAIVQDIRQSVSVPIGEEEVRMCLKILGRELPGDWCRIIEFGSVVSVTLQGNSMSGIEVQKLLASKN